MGSQENKENKEKHFNEEVKDNSRIIDRNTALGVDLENLEEFMDSIFLDEVPEEFKDAMKKKIRVIKYSDKADNFKGKDNQSGLDSNSFVCNGETHYFYFIAEKKDNKMDISYTFFVGKVAIEKAYTITKGEKKVDKNINYRKRLKEVINNPLEKNDMKLIKQELKDNLIEERKNNLLKN